MKAQRPDTLLTHAGNDPRSNHGIVNPPVYHASTVLFPSLAALEESDRNPFEIVNYGRVGTPTSQAFEEACARLDGGYRGIATSSGLAAITTALLACVKAGDHVLITDSVYGPTRRFASQTLTRLGVEVEYYDPLIGSGIAALLRPNTSTIFLESPGSLTFEVQDVPAICATAKAAGVRTIIDNTWATPLFFKPLAHGVDIALQSATKYIVGHSDAMLGIIVTGEALFTPLKRMAVELGNCAGPDDLYLGLRGLRSMAVRLRRHQDSALEVARWLQARPEVARVIHPALPGDAGHDLWRRDFTGASGLFSIVLKPCEKEAVAAMVDGMALFGIGYSWGGYESLILPCHPARIRTATRWDELGPVVRLHIGLEDVADLTADLEAGFARLAEAAR